MSLNTENLLDVTHLNTRKLIQAAYDNSQPVGMGFMHFTPEPLSDAEADALIRADGSVSLDYVKGRCCKFHIWVEGDKKYTRKEWYDHTSAQLEAVLEAAAQ